MNLGSTLIFARCLPYYRSPVLTCQLRSNTTASAAETGTTATRTHAFHTAHTSPKSLLGEKDHPPMRSRDEYMPVPSLLLLPPSTIPDVSVTAALPDIPAVAVSSSPPDSSLRRAARLRLSLKCSLQTQGPTKLPVRFAILPPTSCGFVLSASSRIRPFSNRADPLIPNEARPELVYLKSLR